MKRIVSYNWILLPVFFTGVLFFYTQLFVEKETLPKEYVFILFSLLLGILLFFKNSQSVQWDRLTVVIFIFTGYILAATIVTGGRSLEILKLVGFLLLFLYFKGSDIKGKHLKIIIVSLWLLQAIYGLFPHYRAIV
jgi:hypothetical protein